MLLLPFLELMNRSLSHLLPHVFCTLSALKTFFGVVTIQQSTLPLRVDSVCSTGTFCPVNGLTVLTRQRQRKDTDRDTYRCLVQCFQLTNRVTREFWVQKH